MKTRHVVTYIQDGVRVKGEFIGATNIPEPSYIVINDDTGLQDVIARKLVVSCVKEIAEGKSL